MTARSGGRLATTVALRQPLDAIREQVTTAEALGYHSIWLPEVTDRDALVLAATLAQATTEIGLATGVVPLPTRSLPLLAMSAMSAAEASNGRLLLGVGLGHTEMIGPWHHSGGPTIPADVGPTLTALRGLMAGEPRSPEPGGAPAALFRLRGYAAPPPIILGGLSEAIVRVAGESADGVLLNWVTADRAATLARVARQAAARAGRDPEQFIVAAYLPVAVTAVSAETADARLRLARQVAAYTRLGAYRRSLERSGWGEQAGRAATAGPGDPEAVPAALLDVLGAIGSPTAVRARIDEFREVGVDLPVLAPVPAGTDPWASMVATWTELAPGG